MNVLPRISGREVVRALRKIGYNRDRQRGSHIVLGRTAPPHQRITVPDHKEVAKGTLRTIIRLLVRGPDEREIETFVEGISCFMTLPAAFTVSLGLSSGNSTRGD